MYSFNRENQDEIMEEIPIFTWEITSKCSQVILMQDLILLNKQGCDVNQSSYFRFTTEDLRKVKQLYERSQKRKHVAELLKQSYKDCIISALANFFIKKVISVKGMLKKGYGYSIGDSVRKSKFTQEIKKWIEINSRNEKVDANSSEAIRNMRLKELKLPEESISLNTFIKHSLSPKIFL
ncbi:hypothetical protein TTHMIC_00005 [Tetrahymena thermophila SB210]|uniref:Uncharacterized protein n=1 Tax=Tetrahymena thermophila (strain SB210) TaxID=312017 RepID=A0A1B9C240_TETTS|nr:hypothetical protein TTHMIC_00005 [Tetrahymena thermophila SB210]